MTDYRLNLTEEFTPEQMELLTEARAKYLKLSHQNKFLRARVIAIDLLLKNKEDPIRPREYW